MRRRSDDGRHPHLPLQPALAVAALPDARFDIAARAVSLSARFSPRQPGSARMRRSLRSRSVAVKNHHGESNHARVARISCASMNSAAQRSRPRPMKPSRVPHGGLPIVDGSGAARPAHRSSAGTTSRRSSRTFRRISRRRFSTSRPTDAKGFGCWWTQATRSACCTTSTARDGQHGSTGARGRVPADADR